jgi:hypothetical protein
MLDVFFQAGCNRVLTFFLKVARMKASLGLLMHVFFDWVLLLSGSSTSQVAVYDWGSVTPSSLVGLLTGGTPGCGILLVEDENRVRCSAGGTWLESYVIYHPVDVGLTTM